MRLLFIKDTKKSDSKGNFKAGTDGHFTNDFAREKVKAGNAIEVPDGQVITQSFIDYAIKQAKK